MDPQKLDHPPISQVVKPSPKVELLVNALAVVRRVDGEESIG